MTGVLSGLLFAVLGGMLNGSFTAPMKFSRNWAWENTWLIYSVIGLLCIPVAMALISVPELMAVYRAADPNAIALSMLFGFGWGVGCVLFGLGINALGMALGFAIILGLTAALGSLIPLIVLSPDQLFTAHGFSILIGLAVVIIGIVVCANAGKMKDAAAHASGDGQVARQRFRVGLLICIGSGIFSSMLNLALAFGAPVAETATRAGATPSAAQNAIWALAVGAGSVANIGYTLLLLFRNRSWSGFGSGPGARNLILAALMGVLWMAGVSVYGNGAAALGDWGPVVGWPLFMSMVIVTGNVWGLATGEWKQAPRAALRMNLAGVTLLIVAIIVISFGSTL